MARMSRGHRRTKRASEGDPRKVRQMRARRTQTREACRFPAACDCVLCRPDEEARCPDCGGAGGGGTMDPDVWIDCGTCSGTGKAP